MSRMRYRSVSFHQSQPNLDLLCLAAELGYNDVTFQTECGTLEPLHALRRRADERGYFGRIRELGMTVSLWVHEFEDVDPAWGEPALNNDRMWDALGERYRYVLTELLPQTDYLVLTVVETQVRATDPRVLARLVGTLNAQCRAAGKRLILRSFVWYPHEAEGIEAAVRQIPDDVIIMTKVVPQDWSLRGPDDPLLGRVAPHEQFIEIDIAGEYFRNDQVACCFTDVLERQYRHALDRGCTGLSVRVDRGWNPSEYQNCVLGQAQEVNLWALAYLATDREGGVEAAWRDYARRTFGPRAADTMIEVLRPTGKVMAESLCVRREPFGNTRSPIPVGRTMQRKPVARPFDPKDDALNEDPFHCNWSAWRWDPACAADYPRLRRGDPQVITEKTNAAALALESAEQSLRLIDSAREDLPLGAHAFFRFKLEENRFHLQAMTHAQLAWLKASRCLHIDDGDETERLRGEIGDHLAAIEALHRTHRHERCAVRWSGRDRSLTRGAYLDLPGFVTAFRQHWRPVLDGRRDV
jgi:hypothetical protein